MVTLQNEAELSSYTITLPTYWHPLYTEQYFDFYVDSPPPLTWRSRARHVELEEVNEGLTPEIVESKELAADLRGEWMKNQFLSPFTKKNPKPTLLPVVHVCICTFTRITTPPLLEQTPWSDGHLWWPAFWGVLLRVQGGYTINK